MRTVRTKVYKLNELNDKAKDAAIRNFSDINVDHMWWEYTYMDADTIGIKITNFDLDSATIDGELIDSLTVSCKLIIANHGDTCDTYKTATTYLVEWVKLVEIDSDEHIAELENKYKRSILRDYLTILQKDYDYLTSKAAITETILANEYEFTQDGKQFYQ